MVVVVVVVEEEEEEEEEEEGEARWPSKRALAAESSKSFLVHPHNRTSVRNLNVAAI